MSIPRRPLKSGSPAAFIGFDGTLTGEVLVDTGEIGPASVCVNRSFRMDRAEGNWIVVVERPETAGIDEHNPHRQGMGGIVVTDPGANEFLDCLAELLASTEAFGNTDHYIGPTPDVGLQ